jgi:hypothetical protein
VQESSFICAFFFFIEKGFDFFSEKKIKKIFGKIDSKRDEKENEKPHSNFIGKKFNVGRHTVIVEVR